MNNVTKISPTRSAEINATLQVAVTVRWSDDVFKSEYISEISMHGGVGYGTPPCAHQHRYQKTVCSLE